MPDFSSTVTEAFSDFGKQATIKLSAGSGSPEAKLRTPIENLLQALSPSLGIALILDDEDTLSDLGARPDWSVLADGLLAGHLELKAPGKGADTSTYTGHDAEQWERLSALPNVLYTDGNQWGLYRFGERVGEIGFTAGDVRTSAQSLAPQDSRIASVLSDFLRWKPVAPRSARQLATVCAHLCRLLRVEVGDALNAGSTPLNALAQDWRDLLFPEATDAEFADGYAQTVTFALLLARAEAIDFDQKPIGEIASALGQTNSLMGKALAILTDPALFEKLATSLTTLHRLVAVVDWSLIERSAGTAVEGEWLYFYEHFLAEYDPQLRKRTGSYYTPNEVVHAMVSICDDLLRSSLGRPDGFAAADVTTVDPAVGTGTFLLHTIDRAAETVEQSQGLGAVPARLEELVRQLVGFEKQTGPYAVAELRTYQAFLRLGARPASDEVRLYLADTLDNPFVEVEHIPAVYGPIARSRGEANHVKAEEKVLVVLGNPPYKEQAKGDGAWVENGHPEALDLPIMDDFVPAEDIRVPGNHSRHLRNLYVYFWRWALWKVFEFHENSQQGVVHSLPRQRG